MKSVCEVKIGIYYNKSLIEKCFNKISSELYGIGINFVLDLLRLF